jgi:hypothetical protein
VGCCYSYAAGADKSRLVVRLDAMTPGCQGISPAVEAPRPVEDPGPHHEASEGDLAAGREVAFTEPEPKSHRESLNSRRAVPLSEIAASNISKSMGHRR